MYELQKIENKGRISGKSNTILSEVTYTCAPDFAANEVQMHHLSNANKREREENTPTVKSVYTEEVGPLSNCGCEQMTEMPSQLVSKITLH